MEKTTMFNGLKKIISDQMIMDNDVTLGNLSEKTKLKSDLGIDSLDLINIVNDVEKHFEIEVGFESIEELHTIGNCLSMIEQKIYQRMVA